MSQAGIISESTAIGGDIKTITGNTGGAVGGDGVGNITITGNTTQGVRLAGTPASNLITVSVDSATIIQRGVVELATANEAQLLVDTTRALTPSNISDIFAVQRNSGFIAFTGAGSYYSVVGTTITIDRGGTGWINNVLVTWNVGQSTGALSAGNTHYIYMDDTGTIGTTTTRTAGLFQNNIVLFEALVDSDTPSNVIVVKENHGIEVNPFAMEALHHLGINGYDVTGTAGGTITANGANSLQINGDTDWHDHDLETDIPDSAAAAVSFKQFYTNGAGKWVEAVDQTTFLLQYNNAGTPTNLAGNERGIYDIRVSKDDLESTTPKYIAVMDDTVYANLALARIAVTNSTFATVTNELAEIETIRMGVIIVNTTGVEEITVAKQTIGTGNVTSVGSSGSLVSLATTNFDGWLSAADTTVQAAIETLDDTGKDGTFYLENTAVGTKRMNFSLAGITAANDRTITMADQNISLVPTTGSFQASDATLTAWAGFNSDGILTQTAADTFAARTLTGTADQVVIANGSGVAGNPTFSLPQSIAVTSSVIFGQVTVDNILLSGATIGYGGTGAIVLDSTGIVTYPLQCAFYAKPNGDKDNVTGNNTLYTVVWDDEVYDRNNDFDGTSTFTAPIGGVYKFGVGFNLSGIVAPTAYQAILYVNGSSHILELCDLANAQRGGIYIVSYSKELYLAAASTVTVRLYANGEGSDIIDLRDANEASYFSGRLVA